MNDKPSELYFDIKRLSETAQAASLNAQEEAQRRGISFVTLQGGRMIREFPSGKRIVIARATGVARKNSKISSIQMVGNKKKSKF